MWFKHVFTNEFVWFVVQQRNISKRFNIWGVTELPFCFLGFRILRWALLVVLWHHSLCGDTTHVKTISNEYFIATTTARNLDAQINRKVSGLLLVYSIKWIEPHNTLIYFIAPQCEIVNVVFDLKKSE